MRTIHPSDSQSPEYDAARAGAEDALIRWARTGAQGGLNSALSRYFSACHADRCATRQDRMARREIALRGLMIRVMGVLEREQWTRILRGLDMLCSAD